MVVPPKLSQKSKGGFALDAWVGDTDAFADVIKTCNELAEIAIRDAEAAISSREADEKAEYFADRSYWTDEQNEVSWQQRRANIREQLRTELQPSVSTVQRKFNQENQGEPNEVLEAVDLHDLRSLRVEFGGMYSARRSEGFGLELSFDRKTGCEVRAVAPSADWIMLVQGKLRPALTSSRPWYWWLRSYKIAPWVFLAPVAVTIYEVLVWLSTGYKPSATSSPILTAVVAYGTFGGMVVLASFLVVGGVRRLLPAFELLRVGRRSIGARGLALVGAIVVWLIGTVVIPIVIR